MDNVKKWMNVHKLKINTDKTEITLFHPKGLENQVIIKGTHFDNQCIRFTPVVKNIGVWLDQHLNMEHHINKIVSKCYQLLKNVCRIRKVLSFENTEILVHTVISSRIDYCNSLYINIEKKHIFKLQKVQNSAARIIKLKNRRHSATSLLNELHWLLIQSRIVFKYLLLVFKYAKGLSSGTMQLTYTQYNCRPCNYLQLNETSIKTKYGKCTFEYVAPKLWNKLPAEIRMIDEISSFKQKIKTFLFSERFCSEMTNC